MTLHPLLGRLLRRVGASESAAPSEQAWQQLLHLLGRTYSDADQDRYTLERSIDISSREMQGLYQDLKRRSESELDAARERIERSYAVVRATLESASEGIIVVDASRSVIAVNRRFTEFFRVPEELVSSADHGLLVERSLRMFPDPEAARRRIAEIHDSAEVASDELTLIDGRVIDRYSAPVRLPDGREVGRVSFFRDITAERAAQQHLEDARLAAVSANQAKSMFLASMSHELRTPLNAVIGFSELLLLPALDQVTPRQREYLEAIATSGTHLLALVNDILDLSKIEAGKQTLERELVDVGHAIDEAVGGLEPLAAKRAITVETTAIRANVYVDRVRLRQILYNLISNALKFTDPGGRVRIAAAREAAGIAIAVSDNGIGIAAHDLPRLYQHFEQLEGPAADRPGGTGLGLALTKRLVELHGGSIEVASTRGVGTAFTVRFEEAA